MAQNTVSTGFSMYNPRRLERVGFGAFQGAGIDQFTDPVAQDPNKFLNLTNVMPSISGAFQRRWGLSFVPLGVGRASQYRRMFSYTMSADTTFPGSNTTRTIMATDNTHTDILYEEVGFATPTYPVFSGTGEVYGVTSRDWFYMSNGIDTPKKIYPGTTVGSAFKSNWGIATPGGTVVDGITYITGSAFGYTGSGYSGTPTIGFSGGGGTGAAASCSSGIGTNQGLSSSNLTITNGGSGYTSPPLVTVTGGGGSGASFTAVVETSPASPYYQTVVGIIMTGNIVLNAGRTYAIALQNTGSGHVSNFISMQNPGVYPINGATQFASEAPNVLNTGCNALEVDLSIPSASVDAQVGAVVLMATSDGGSLETLYEVQIIPLASFTLTGGNYTLTYTDLLPDTYNDVYQTGPTLLAQNLWVDVNTAGDVIGINDNTPPLTSLNKTVVSQGRMFATDGVSVYFSKSIDEVTTSTGLITSKWEEAWPGSNVLDIAYGDELITSLLSDGETLYIGTTDNVYRLLGDNSSNFSIPATIWRGVGVKSQDTWSVVYKDNVPAGYMWVTTDNKIMFSDFNTYTEVGRPVYPLISAMGPITHVQSLSYGPYSFAFFAVSTTAGFSYFIYDTKNGGWYLWTDVLASPSGTYITPILSYTLQNGVQQMYSVNSLSSGSTEYLCFFDPAATQDVDLNTRTTFNSIPWLIETSWINLMDTASSIVLNELELWSDDPFTTISVYRALNSVDFDTPILVKTGLPLETPFGNKLPLAGTNSFGRFHKVRFYTNLSTGLSQLPNVLRQFQFEIFPQARA